MKTTSNCSRLNISAETAGTRHTRRRPAKSASEDSASRVERMFLAELGARRTRLKKWLRLVEREVLRENGYQQRRPQARA